VGDRLKNDLQIRFGLVFATPELKVIDAEGKSTFKANAQSPLHKLTMPV
jgi:hypothetical protein